MKDDAALIRDSGYFKAAWYTRTYPDVALSGMDPVEHYLRLGWLMDRDPGPHFSTRHYREAYPAAQAENPLVHHLRNRTASITHPRTALARVRGLREQLWSGLEGPAEAALAAVIADPAQGQAARAEASLVLATWLAFTDRTAEARALLERIALIAPDHAGDKARAARRTYLAMIEGDFAAAAAALAEADAAEDDPDLTLLRANLASDAAGRLALINQVLARRGLLPIRQTDPDRPLGLDTIACPPAPALLPDIGRVSIIMPVFEAEATIGTALRALMAQTYRNLEIIVVDDCSGDGTLATVEALAAEDPRIIPIRQDRNRGAYPARNRGLLAATGDFVTTHDADDWSHAQKIETQLRGFMVDPDLQATAIHWARCRRDLMFTTGWRLETVVIHWSYSSFMVRRGVVERLGGWDPVRTGADSEYVWRVTGVFGERAFAKLAPDVPLAFALDHGGSLTRAKNTHLRTNYHGLRRLYREVARYWIDHRDPADHQAAEKLAMLPPEMTDRDAAAPAVDLHLIGDCSDRGVIARMRAVLAERTSTMGRPPATGVEHRPHPDRMPQPFDGGYFTLVSAAHVRPILPGAPVAAGETLVIPAGPD